MSCCVYILKSQKLDRYYVSYTCDDLTSRVKKHNRNHKGYTCKANDWVIVYQDFFARGGKL